MIAKRLTPMLTLLLLVSSNVRAQSENLQSLPALQRAAEKSVIEVIGPGIGPVLLQAAAVDPRLRLAACPSALDAVAAAPRATQNRVTVRVSCAAPAWTVNLPVEIRRRHPVLILQRAVGRGEVLAVADVSVQTRVLPGLASPFVAGLDQLAGRVTRRPLPAGVALPADALTEALLIRRGQQVTLVAQAEGFQVRAPGRAMADASARQRLRVQNLNSLKVVEGVADSDGTVRVMP